mmetsp:Transcript_25602/g.64265  ORF Transcript_25602/g.64265 Transcript_25602/m.64265 type:complete len:274 (-) Transcript_25602:290-1111(-)
MNLLLRDQRHAQPLPLHLHSHALHTRIAPRTRDFHIGTKPRVQAAQQRQRERRGEELCHCGLHQGQVGGGLCHHHLAVHGKAIKGAGAEGGVRRGKHGLEVLHRLRGLGGRAPRHHLARHGIGPNLASSVQQCRLHHHPLGIEVGGEKIWGCHTTGRLEGAITSHPYHRTWSWRCKRAADWGAGRVGQVGEVGLIHVGCGVEIGVHIHKEQPAGCGVAGDGEARRSKDGLQIPQRLLHLWACAARHKRAIGQHAVLCGGNQPAGGVHALRRHW